MRIEIHDAQVQILDENNPYDAALYFNLDLCFDNKEKIETRFNAQINHKNEELFLFISLKEPNNTTDKIYKDIADDLTKLFKSHDLKATLSKYIALDEENKLYRYISQFLESNPKKFQAALAETQQPQSLQSALSAIITSGMKRVSSFLPGNFKKDDSYKYEVIGVIPDWYSTFSAPVEEKEVVDVPRYEDSSDDEIVSSVVKRLSDDDSNSDLWHSQTQPTWNDRSVKGSAKVSTQAAVPQYDYFNDAVMISGGPSLFDDDLTGHNSRETPRKATQTFFAPTSKIKFEKENLAAKIAKHISEKKCNQFWKESGKNQEIFLKKIIAYCQEKRLSLLEIIKDEKARNYFYRNELLKFIPAAACTTKFDDEQLALLKQANNNYSQLEKLFSNFLDERGLTLNVLFNQYPSAKKIFGQYLHLKPVLAITIAKHIVAYQESWWSDVGENQESYRKKIGDYALSMGMSLKTLKELPDNPALDIFLKSARLKPIMENFQETEEEITARATLIAEELVSNIDNLWPHGGRLNSETSYIIFKAQINHYLTENDRKITLEELFKYAGEKLRARGRYENLERHIKKSQQPSIEQRLAQLEPLAVADAKKAPGLGMVSVIGGNPHALANEQLAKAEMRRLKMEHHPDKDGGEKEKFQKVQELMEVQAQGKLAKFIADKEEARKILQEKAGNTPQPGRR